MAVRNIKTESGDKRMSRGGEDDAVIKVSRTLSMVLSNQLSSNKKARQALEDADRRATGAVSRESFRRALEDISVDLQENEWKQLLEQLDPEHRGHIKYNMFLSWLGKLTSKDGVHGDEGKLGRRGDGGIEESGSSYEGKRNRNMEPHEAVELTVEELHITDRGLIVDHKGAQVWVSYRFLEDHDHETPKEELRDAHVDLNHVRTFPVGRSSPELRQALSDALHRGRRKPARGVIEFVAMCKEHGRR